MVLVRFCFGSFGVVPPPEVAPLRLLVMLVVVEEDLARGWRDVAEADFTAVTSSVVISAMMSKRHFFATGA